MSRPFRRRMARSWHHGANTNGPAPPDLERLVEQRRRRRERRELRRREGAS